MNVSKRIMGKIHTKVIHKKGISTDGQKQMLNITNNERNANQNYKEGSPHQSEWPS